MTKKFVSMFLALVMCVSLSIPAIAVGKKSEEAIAGETSTTSQSCITFEEYLEKYGKENVIRGFAAAEAEAMGMDQAELASLQSADGEKGKSLFECLSEGEFLGLKVLGVSDVAPGEPGFMIRVEEAPGLSDSSELETDVNMPSSLAATNPHVYPHYNVYYSSIVPDDATLSNAYEPLAGSYFKKRADPWAGFYQCNTTVTFDNTQLYCGSQNLNLYIYLNVKSNAAVIDFGLMGNAASNEVGKGLYAFYNEHNAETSKMWIEAFPKVKAITYGNRAMTLEKKTVTIELSVDKDTEMVTMYMKSNNSMIFYTQHELSGMGSGQTMTFMQAMAYLCSKDGEKTQFNSGGYVGNVKFNDTVLFNKTEGKRDFLTVSPVTYYTMICEPDYISYIFNDTTNAQMVNITYWPEG